MLWKINIKIERNMNSLTTVVNRMSLRYSTNPLGYRNGAGVQQKPLRGERKSLTQQRTQSTQKGQIQREFVKKYYNIKNLNGFKTILNEAEIIETILLILYFTTTILLLSGIDRIVITVIVNCCTTTAGLCPPPSTSSVLWGCNLLYKNVLLSISVTKIFETNINK